MTAAWTGQAVDEDRDLHPKQPRAIHSALVVLEEVAKAGPGVTVRELVDRLALPRATVYRLVNLLVQEEYLVRLADISGLALGRKVAELAGPRPPAGMRLSRAARESLAEVRARTSPLAVHLVAYEEDGPRPLDADPVVPLHDAAALARDPQRSAAGRLWLAERRDGGAGLAVQSDALAAGWACAAIPLRAEDGALVAALCVAGPSDRMEELLAAAQALRGDAERLAALLT